MRGLLKVLNFNREFKFISDFDGNRSNNFLLLRIIFALAVLFGHSYPISGNGTDPLSRALPAGYPWIGGLAVSGFFAISGFLITASYASRGGVSFFIARVLRLYPAVIVYCAFAILVIGPLAAEVDLRAYFLTERWDYMSNALLVSWRANLPYVFTDRPLGGATNGSMWTLPIELRSYVLVAILGIVGIWRNKLAANVAIFFLLYTFWFGKDLSYLFDQDKRYLEPMIFFLFGAGFWVNRNSIPLVWFAVPLALIFPAIFHNIPDIHRVIYPLSICYLIFYVSYAVPVLNLDRVGDISYGVYIYAWPIQQLVWWRGQSALENAGLAAMIVIPLAYASWRLVERPAIALKAYVPSGSIIGNVRNAIQNVRRSKARGRAG